ncbi:MAG: ACT domain-containing protein [Clostridium sp.]|nr:ACT domain-containing protein [Clostridium sp.]MCM1548164.1 ACT domain-containing protein [Ruminococcus sp.]
MTIKQISIFVENKPGRLKEVTNILKDNSINIRALSIADTKDFGILRIIVNDPEKACAALKNAKCTVTITEVLAVGIEDKPGGITTVMDTLYENKISVEYMYAFVSKSDDDAYVILRVVDNKNAAEVLSDAGIRLLSSKEIYDM